MESLSLIHILYCSGLDFTYNPNRMILNKVTDVYLDDGTPVSYTHLAAGDFVGGIRHSYVCVVCFDMGDTDFFNLFLYGKQYL